MVSGLLDHRVTDILSSIPGYLEYSDSRSAFSLEEFEPLGC